ncbi:MAG: D,D-heptose 1,7-bisphosphate phosphatase [Sulfurimonas sp.]|nr:MAG: D,D-heptose 1,7-bisphosphate phosphatase [Sulfurimonas sp.]
MDGIFTLCKYYQSLGYIVVVVTNQSGIARNYYTEEDFDELTSWMLKEFSFQDIDIKMVYHCPHHPDISGECSCRKPNPGMLLQAASELNIDLKNSIIIGDKERDILAGINAGLTTTYLFDESNSIQASQAKRIVSKLEDIYC